MPPPKTLKPSDLALLEQVAIQLTDRARGLSRGELAMPTASVVKVLAAAAIGAADRVIVLGSRNGFLLAALARLAREVIAVERHRVFAEQLSQDLARVAAGKVQVGVDRRVRLPEELAPFDVICNPGATKSAAEQQWRLLAPGGRWVGILPTGQGHELIRVIREGESGCRWERLGSIRTASTFAEVLVDLGLTGEADVQSWTEGAGGERQLLGFVTDNGLLAEPDLILATACVHGMQVAPVEELIEGIDLEIVRTLPRRFLEFQGCVPLKLDRGAVAVATRDLEFDPSDIAQAFEPRPIHTYLLSATDFRRLWIAIDLLLDGREIGTAEAVADRDHPGVARQSQDVVVLFASEETGDTHPVDTDDAQARRLLESVLLDGVGSGASDIHMEFGRTTSQIRLRIDGCLRHQRSMSPAAMARIVNVFKVQAGMDIAEHRRPQGGSMRLRVGSRTFDLRIQCQPSMWGENVVIRILRQGAGVQTIDDLGFSLDMATEFRRVMAAPSGMVLVVGPTGSGKSTTLYSGLRMLAEDTTKKVVTIEDPVEYSIAGVQQSQTNGSVGFGFAEAVRSLLRQDPDAILVGEIRDAETAQEAIRASQTGHLVLSTLHCNETTDAVQRLVDLGGDAVSLAGELIAVLSQRLARRLCPSCRFPSSPSPTLVRDIFPTGLPEGFTCFEGGGCSRCNGNGLSGRVAVLEFLRVDDSLRNLITRDATAYELRDHALRLGLHPLRDRALELVANGVIPLADLPRFLPIDRLAPETPAPG